MPEAVPEMNELFRSGRLHLAGHLAVPEGENRKRPGLVIAHGFPAGLEGGTNSAATFPGLADRIAEELGWVVLTFNYRGCGGSEGEFSLLGWLDDMLAATAFVAARSDVEGVWAAGFGTGGALSVCAGARSRLIRGVAALAAPADFEDWARHPRRLLDHARQVEVINDRGFPRSFESWARELQMISAVRSAERMRGKSLLLVHGSEDEVVPVFDARMVGDAHQEAEIRVITGAAHHLRHDPRAIAIFMGWLTRQQHRRGVTF